MLELLKESRAPGVELGYRLSEVPPGYVSVPDGRCGIAYARGSVWWFGPSSVPAAAEELLGPVVGVRLTFEAARVVAGGPLRPWRDRKIPLMTLWGRSAVEALTEQLAAASYADEILKTLEAAVGGRVPPEPDQPSFADELAARVAAGTSVAELAGWMGTNTRQVARRCDDIFGMAPTRLRRVLRLQQAARHRFEHPGLSLSELASASGYSDQSHLSRDSRELAASTPRAAFG